MTQCGSAPECTHPLSVEPALLVEVAEIVLIGGRAEEPQVTDLRADDPCQNVNFLARAQMERKSLASKLVQK